MRDSDNTRPNCTQTYRHFDKITPAVVGASVELLNSVFSNSSIHFTLASIEQVINATWFNASIAASASDVDAIARAQQHRGGRATLNIVVRQLPEGQLAAATFPWYPYVSPAFLPFDLPSDDYDVAALDGIVVDGATLPGATLNGNSVPPQYESAGGALAHATAHWLGLLDTSYGVSLAADGDCLIAADGDGCNDTPPHLVLESGSCGNATSSCPNQIAPGSNVMATLEGGCSKELTPDQGKRMRKAWVVWRQGGEQIDVVCLLCLLMRTQCTSKSA